MRGVHVHNSEHFLVSGYKRMFSKDCTRGVRFFAPCKGISDSLGFRIPGTGFQYLSVELGFWIPIVSGIPDSLSCIPDSKTKDSGFLKQNFQGSRIPQAKISRIPSLTWGEIF